MARRVDQQDDERLLVHTVVGAIEDLRRKRRAEWRDRAHPDGKRFTQEELCHMAYPSYHNMVVGKTRRLPSRQAMLRIADYLECTIQEMNELLGLAQYLPEVRELREDEQQAALAEARAIMHALPLPAGIVNFGWVVEDINRAMRVGNGLADDFEFASKQITPFHTYGDPAHPSYQHYAFDKTLWRRTVRNKLRQFRTAHHRYHRERWYRHHLERILALPGFRAIWNSLDDNQDEPEQAGTTYTWSHQLQTAFHDASVILPVGPGYFPYVTFYYPVDAAAFAAYEMLGCPVAENRWEHALPTRPPAL